MTQYNKDMKLDEACLLKNHIYSTIQCHLDYYGKKPLSQNSIGEEGTITISEPGYYYLIENTRLTHDENIKYYKFKGKIIKKEQNEIFEIKTNYETDLNKLYLMFPMNRTRFSKYCNAYDKFFN